MDPATAIAVFVAVARAFPDLINAIKSVAESFAGEHGLDGEALVRAIAADHHEQVDAVVDNEIEAHQWPRP